MILFSALSSVESFEAAHVYSPKREKIFLPPLPYGNFFCLLIFIFFWGSFVYSESSIFQDFIRKRSLQSHVIQCKIKARTVLIEDGMDADEAIEAVQLPSSATTLETDGESYDSDEEEARNIHKLKKCSISIKRFWYIEEAVKRGCRSVQFFPFNRNAKPKPIF